MRKSSSAKRKRRRAPLTLDYLHPRRKFARYVVAAAAAAFAQELYVGNNQIASVAGEDVSRLGALCVLELRDNKIATLPEQVAALGALTRLDLANNDIGT